MSDSGNNKIVVLIVFACFICLILSVGIGFGYYQYNKNKEDQKAQAKIDADKKIADAAVAKALADQTAAAEDLANADHSSVSEALANKAIADKALSDAAAIADKNSTQQAALDAKILADKLIADKIIADKAALDAKTLADQITADRVALEAKIIADKAIADKAIADKIALDAKTLADKIIADKAAADKIIADKAIADKIIADKAIADKLLSDNAPPQLVSGPLIVGNSYIITNKSNGTELGLTQGTSGVTRKAIDLTQSKPAIISNSANFLWLWDGTNLVSNSTSLGLNPVNVSDTRYKLSFGSGSTCLIFSGNGTNMYTSLFSWGGAGSCGLGSDENFLTNQQGVFQFYLVKGAASTDSSAFPFPITSIGQLAGTWYVDYRVDAVLNFHKAVPINTVGEMFDSYDSNTYTIVKTVNGVFSATCNRPEYGYGLDGILRDGFMSDGKTLTMYYNYKDPFSGVTSKQALVLTRKV